jgi:5-methylcytosine-specific restriction endonuclease McrA
MSERRDRWAAYIASEAWSFRRMAALRRARYTCTGCGRRDRRLEVHHLTYEHLGDEPDDDLVVLCVTCHRRADDLRRLKDRPSAYARAVQVWAKQAVGPGWGLEPYGPIKQEFDAAYLRGEIAG